MTYIVASQPGGTSQTARITHRVGGDAGATHQLGGGPQGSKGWSPLLGLTPLEGELYLKVNDWVGGEGAKPDETGYVGALGLQETPTGAPSLVPTGIYLETAQNLADIPNKASARGALALDRVLSAPSLGSFTRTLNQRDWEWVSPRDLGSPGDGSDDTARLDALIDHVIEEYDVPAILMDGYFRCAGQWDVNKTVRIFGRNPAIDRIHLDIDPTIAGIYITGSNVTIENLRITVDTPAQILNGQGHNNTCITVGEWFNETGLTAVENTRLKNLKLERVANAGSGHAIAAVGRVRGLYVDDCLFLGGGPTSATGRHASAILGHWGGKNRGVRTPDDPSYPLIQYKFEPGCYSHHPNDIRVRNARFVNCSRAGQFSACYGITYDGFHYDGGVDGGQLFDLVAGDEGDKFAHPEDYGRVFSDISFRNGSATNLTGVGSQANSVIDLTGNSASKQTPSDLAGYADIAYADDHYGGKVSPIYSAPEMQGITFENIRIDGGPRDSRTDYRGVISLRNARGNITFKNVKGFGNQGNLGVQLSNVGGNIVFEDCDLRGGVEKDEVSNVTFKNCKLSVPREPVIQLRVTGTAEDWELGATIVGGTSGATGELIRKVDESTTEVLVQMRNWQEFTITESVTADGADAQVVAAQSHYRNSALKMDGEVATSYLGAAVLQNDETVTLASQVPFYALNGTFSVSETITFGTSGATATITAVQVGPAVAGYPTASTEGRIWCSAPTKPVQQNETITGGTSGATAKVTNGWVASQYAVPIEAKTADFTVGDTITGALSGATRVVTDTLYTAKRATVWLHDGYDTDFVVGEVLEGGGFSATITAYNGNQITLSNVVGNIITNEEVEGNISGAISFVKSKKVYEANGIISVSGGSGLFQDMETVTGAISGSARVRAESAADLVAIPFDAQTANFAVNEYVTGGWSGMRGFVSAQTDAGASGVLYLYSTRPTELEFIDNEPLIGDQGGAAVANIPLGPIPASSNGGFTVSVLPGDEISYSGGTLTVAEYRRVRETVISIKPAPAAGSLGAVVTCDHRTKHIQLENCQLSGGQWVVSAEQCRAISMIGGSVSNGGIYGWTNITNAEAHLDNVTFQNNGLARNTGIGAAVTTRDLAIAYGRLTGARLKFRDSAKVLHNVAISSTADFCRLDDCQFLGTPITGKISAAAILANGQPALVERCVDASFAPVRMTQQFTPLLNFGGATTGIVQSTSNGWYNVNGDRIEFDIYIVLTSKGTATGLAGFTGIPFPVTGGASTISMVALQNATGLTNSMWCRMISTGNSIFLMDADGVANLTDANFTNTTTMRITGSYRWC